MSLMKRLFCIILSICLLLMSGCSKSGSITDDISMAIGIDLSDAEYATRIDTHGGFHGDGSTIVSMPVSSESVLEQIQNNPQWHSLPFTENLTAVVYGITDENSSIGPYITVDDTRNPAVPEITNGYYFFLDRHSQSTDPHDDTNVLSRASFNLLIAIYDCDTDILYYLELDT